VFCPYALALAAEIRAGEIAFRPAHAPGRLGVEMAGAGLGEIETAQDAAADVIRIAA
jgi:hypothetical protein